MLYLLRTYGKEKSLLKIGYAGDIFLRTSQYKSHNPLVEIIDTREGSLYDELKLHLYLHALGYGAVMDEWYEDREDVISAFRDFPGIEDLDAVIWQNRDALFSKSILDSIGESEEGLSEVFGDLFDKFYKMDDGSYDTKKIVCSDVKLDYKFFSKREKKVIQSRLTEEGYPAELVDFLSEFNLDENFVRRMKLLCKFISENESFYNKNYKNIYANIPMNYQTYISTIGVGKIKAVNYRESVIIRLINTVLKKRQYF